MQQHGPLQPGAVEHAADRIGFRFRPLRAAHFDQHAQHSPAWPEPHQPLGIGNRPDPRLDADALLAQQLDHRRRRRLGEIN